MTEPKSVTTLSLIRSALQDAIQWEESRIDAGMRGPFRNKKYEKLLNELGHITREQAFARKLKADGSQLINAFDIQEFVRKNP